jgi:hypothetical protein
MAKRLCTLKLRRSSLLSQHRNAAEAKYPKLNFGQVPLQYLKMDFLHGDDKEGYMNFLVMGDVQNREYDESEGPHCCESYRKHPTKDINPASMFSYVALGI